MTKFEEFDGITLPEKGVFVEVGGYDGETNSLTCELADSGWHGIYVEPIYHAHIRNRHIRNNVQVYAYACGECLGSANITVAGQNSSLSKEFTDAVDKVPDSWGFNKGKATVEVAVLPLDSIVGLLSIDLLVVDVEGSEAEVLKGFTGKPKVVIIEMHEQTREWTKLPFIAERNAWINEHMEKLGYRKTYSGVINTTYAI